uniref:RDD family protein n=2 Tax=unclassified Microbacterium TaxID=2609290 RepID=UPI003869CD8B
MTGRSPAALRHRVFAVLIDAAVTTGVLAVAGSVVVTLSALTDGAVPLTALLPTAAGASAVWFVVQTALQGGAGSVGMRAMGLRLAYADDDQDLGFGRALGRNLIWVAAGSIVVGFFSPLFDGSSWRRGWHDLATAAVMTDAVPRRATTSPGSRLADLVSDVAPASSPALAPVAPTPAPVTSAPPQVVPEPVVIALGSVAPSPA